MSLLAAVQGSAGLYQSLPVQDYNERVRLQFGNKDEYANPMEVRKIQDTDTFRAQLEARAADAIERPTMHEMIERGVDHVDARQKYAGNQVRMLMTGESDNLHQAMIAMEESGVAFNLMLETRNKLMGAYQELMRMNV